MPEGSDADRWKRFGADAGARPTASVARNETNDLAATTVKAGDVLFVPAGVVHSVKNIGRDNGAELATYVVEKGKPLIALVK